MLLYDNYVLIFSKPVNSCELRKQVSCINDIYFNYESDFYRQFTE